MRWAEIVFSYNGLLALCLAMPKHFRQVLTQPLTGILRYILRVGGWLALIVSFAASVMAHGWSFGPVEWVGMLTVTGSMLITLLPYAPRVAATIGVVGFLAIPVFLLL